MDAQINHKLKLTKALLYIGLAVGGLSLVFFILEIINGLGSYSFGRLGIAFGLFGLLVSSIFMSPLLFLKLALSCYKKALASDSETEAKKGDRFLYAFFGFLLLCIIALLVFFYLMSV